ncbi:membrane protein insertase YidC [Pelagibacteraceae bacterium]|jgi:YidC/Oxa1 family membrane protein insertase|nr:membrane protein insertase YidC [Pelagibacteraceae bacterium]
MENKNVFIAIALSMSVLLFWSAFVDSPQLIEKQNQDKLNSQIENKITDNSIVPSIDGTIVKENISREDSLKKTNRILLENKKIKGSISLKGAAIDDLSFKNYNVDIRSNNIVQFLNPKETKNSYFVESGWASIGNKIKVPNGNSIWSVAGNKVLDVNNPVILEWDNGSNLVFRKKIEIDDNYLFKVNQEVKNNSSQQVELYPYAQLTRKNKPEDLKGFYILHEGFIAVLDEELMEDDYDDIEEKKLVREAEKGWIGITDKYWMTALIPESGEKFKSTFLYQDAYKANFLLTNPKIVKPSAKANNEIKIFVAAKEVQTIDAYAEKENIEKLDLIIDWGWFYFFTKPLFFAVDYLFKLTGNFGTAIVLITIMIRLLFFPLANYSFKSMAKMKALQPEMVRLKDLYKDDKVKLQQAMMALYKKEQINPASGCLPVLIQIPFFFAIYKMLFISLEMRHQPFFGWIKDLSASDPTTIFNLFGLLPFTPPSFLIIGIWPILMGLTMFIQQKLNPAPTDPIQAKIFMFFPIFLTVILASFPSGLVVYWTVNNILTIAQQWFIIKRTTVKTN